MQRRGLGRILWEQVGLPLEARRENVDLLHGAARLESEPPLLLYVGTMEHRKNLVRLVAAFALLRERRRIPHRLVLAGKPGYGWKEVRAAIERAEISDCVETPGYVSSAELARLYGSAEIFVFPSVYEGFGLPVLEAMARGTPVACSNAASLPEVAGDAAAYFDPLSVEEIAAAIEGVIDSPGRQAELRQQGMRQAARFTWQACAQKHVEVYRQFL